jgi:uncharacterized membrane protein (DUF485 family)
MDVKIGGSDASEEATLRVLAQPLRWLEAKPERLLAFGVVVGVGLIIVGLVTRGVVTVLGIFVLAFVTPLLYLRQRLLNWIDRQRKAAKEPRDQ